MRRAASYDTDCNPCCNLYLPSDSIRRILPFKHRGYRKPRVRLGVTGAECDRDTHVFRTVAAFKQASCTLLAFRWPTRLKELLHLDPEPVADGLVSSALPGGEWLTHVVVDGGGVRQCLEGRDGEGEHG